jgi:hypothetical protein
VGEGPGRRSRRSRRGSGRVGLAPGERDAAVSATALAGRARDGRGCREWRNARGRVTGASRMSRGSRTSSQRRRESQSSARLLMTFEMCCRLSGCHSDLKVDNASQGRVRTLPRIADNCELIAWRPGFVPSLCRLFPPTPHVPGVSWRPQPARAVTRRPGRISDGRTRSRSTPPGLDDVLNSQESAVLIIRLYDRFLTAQIPDRSGDVPTS